MSSGTTRNPRAPADCCCEGASLLRSSWPGWLMRLSPMSASIYVTLLRIQHGYAERQNISVVNRYAHHTVGEDAQLCAVLDQRRAQEEEDASKRPLLPSSAS